MAPVQIGRLHKHVGESTGPDNNIMKFYITEYSSRVGIDGFQPRKGQHSGTGYQSNFRPGVYYSRKLDELDNPEMGRIVSKNYHSLTHKDYQPYKDCNGTETLPSKTFIKSTGFEKDQHRTVPSSKEAYAMFPNLVMKGHTEKKPLLHSIKNINPIDRENGNSGPAYFSTENHTQFTKKHQLVDTFDKNLGPQEDTGFTRAKNIAEPVTHYPESSYEMGVPLKSLYNPIGDTVTKTSYQPFVHGTGKEHLEDIALNANRDTGFTRFIQPTAAHTGMKGKVYTKLSDVNNPFALEKIKKQDPAEYTNMINPSQYPSFSTTSYNQKPLHGPDLTNKFGKLEIGRKENTGHTDNNKSYYSQPDAMGRFNTTYNQGYYDKSRLPKTEYARINDQSVREQQDDGYTRSEKLHTRDVEGYDVGKQLKSLHPYVNRSLKARDPFYAENKYAHKQRSSVLIG